MKRIFTLIALTLLLVSCRNETQNTIRRSIQEFTSDRMYITLYSLDGKTVFQGIVDGKVSRSVNEESESGEYIFWFDERGRYHQSDLPYLVSSYDRDAE
jgi:uncharacterized protein YcfL